MKNAVPVAAALLLSACGDDVALPVQRGEPIECALAGTAFERSCSIETREGQSGLTVTLWNPRGGFRRILLPRDGSGAVAADGAEPARVTVIADGRAEVAIGGDRYRLPVSLGPERR